MILNYCGSQSELYAALMLSKIGHSCFIASVFWLRENHASLRIAVIISTTVFITVVGEEREPPKTKTLMPPQVPQRDICNAYADHLS